VQTRFGLSALYESGNIAETCSGAPSQKKKVWNETGHRELRQGRLEMLVGDMAHHLGNRSFFHDRETAIVVCRGMLFVLFRDLNIMPTILVTTYIK
jgi:hypothetical protein